MKDERPIPLPYLELTEHHIRCAGYNHENNDLDSVGYHMDRAGKYLRKIIPENGTHPRIIEVIKQYNRDARIYRKIGIDIDPIDL